jgi:hypothetical protein
MADVTVFKVERLTEGGFVTYAPNYSQFSENLDLAAKRLVTEADAWAKDLAAQIAQEKKDQAAAQAGKPH